MKIAFVTSEDPYDIRSWSPDHLKMGKGVTMTKEEIIALKKLMVETDL